MKKLFFILMIVLFPCSVFAEEIQLTDYDFTFARRMFDGYNYVEYSNAFEYNVEANVLKNNGAELFTPAEYAIQYGYGVHGKNEIKKVTLFGVYIYPQSYDGKHFLVYTNKGRYLLDSEGQVMLDAEEILFPLVPFMSENYYYFKFSNHDGTNTVGIFDSLTHKKITAIENVDSPYDTSLYYNAKKDEFAVIYMNEKLPKTAKITLEIYDKTTLKETCNMEVQMNYQDSSFKNDIISRDYDSIILKGHEYIWLPAYEGVSILEDVPKPEFLKINRETEESESERVDKTYTFKEKEINGVKYYALFKELKDGESAADFIPTERPDGQYSDNIDKMTADKLLFNNELCFFDRGITKLDFGIVLGRAYCKAINYNIDNFTSDTHFVDVNHPYCLYLADKGILGSDNDLYINEKVISQRTVLSALNKTAADNRILTEWSKVKEIQDTEEECSRELAYSEIYKLYELLQNPDTPKDIGAMAGIYIIIGSLLILFVGSFLNDRFKCKTVK